MLVLLEEAREGRVALTVPATALAQAMRSPARQARLSRLIRQPEAQIEPLDAPTGKTAAELRAHRATHTKQNSWWMHDAKGIPLCRVCDECVKAAKAGYNPAVFNSDRYDREIEDPLDP